MSRIERRFQALRQAGRKALIPFVTAGDPHPDVTVDLMHGLVKAGADIVELGVPFSDPIGDGPVIQLACERALAHGTSLRQVLAMVEQFRQTDQDTPVVLMGYMNPIEVMGGKTFAEAAAAVGVDGVLTVDLPPEEMDDLSSLLAGAGLDPIFLVAPTTTAERMHVICDNARGFVYYVSLKGVTGADTVDLEAVAGRVDSLHGMTGLPVGVGFGISTPEKAASMSRIADAVVVGSALVRLVEANQHDHAAAVREVTGLLAAMREAIDADAGVAVDVRSAEERS
ncbi:tryptophan synthase alpha chain [Natronocella acetinitrilica]|uniref:Tryptophan synthase alpha chain n=1 Tax=Natronocella acetinitrilica TaxID=414046 RepID=A0AAE3G216_9GAMM|nr:tryptophan synthase subunit alpha [Natronocella acetinitrilica]MCP1673718.1 tryptophan synthase alpha chain [Natronocella acetinitrilica]